MKSFNEYSNIQSIMEDILLEVKENVLNRYLKIHKNNEATSHHFELHPGLVASELPEKIKNSTDAVRFGVEHGQDHHQKIAFGQWALDGHVQHKDNEDAATLRNFSGRHRSMIAKGILPKGHKFNYSSPSMATHYFNQLDPTGETSKIVGSPEERNILKAYKNHHIGSIETEEHGPLDVYNFHKDTHGQDRIDQAQKDFIKPSCGKNPSWCVAQPGEHGQGYFNQYSDGQGFNLYTRKGTAHAVLAHGNGDRGIVDKQNGVIDSHDEISKKTNDLVINNDEIRDSERGILYSHQNDHPVSAGRLQQYMQDNPENAEGTILDIAANNQAGSKTARMALAHPSAQLGTVIHGAKHSSPLVVRDAINHKEHGRWQQVMAAALQNGELDNAKMAMKHENFDLSNIKQFSSIFGLPNMQTQGRQWNDPESAHIDIQNAAYEHPDFKKMLQRPPDGETDINSDTVGHLMQHGHPHIIDRLRETDLFNTTEPNSSGKTHLDRMLHNRSERINQEAFEHPDIGKEQLNSILNTSEGWTTHKLMNQALDHPKIETEHLKSFFSNISKHASHTIVSLKKKALAHPEMDWETLKDIVHRGHAPEGGIFSEIINHPKFDKKLFTDMNNISSIMNHNDSDQNVQMLNHKFATADSIESKLDMMNSLGNAREGVWQQAYNTALTHPKVQHHGNLISKIINRNTWLDNENVHAVIDHPKVDNNHLFGIMSNSEHHQNLDHPEGRRIAEKVLNHPKVDGNTVELIGNTHHHPVARELATSHPLHPTGKSNYVKPKGML